MIRIGATKTLLLVWLALSLAACSSPAVSSPSPTTPLETATLPPASATPEPTQTFTPEPPTATATTPPTATDTPTVTFTPAPTATATITPTSTAVMVQAGFYNTGGCALSHPVLGGSGDIDYQFCVVNVEVRSDLHMIFNVSWKVNNIDTGSGYAKSNDQGNGGIYLKDNLGNQYNHISGGGGAYKNVLLQNNQVVTGWFEFGKPKVGAVSFTFYDESHSIVIKGIPMIFPTVIFGAFNLQNFPLSLEFSTIKWAMGSLADGSPGLVHQKIQGCAIQEKAGAQPQGKLYNISQKIGDATYAIYGATDPATNQGYREYVLLGGADLVQAGQPLFLVTIPLDNATTCVYDASDVLAKLSVRQP